MTFRHQQHNKTVMMIIFNLFILGKTIYKRNLTLLLKFTYTIN